MTADTPPDIEDSIDLYLHIWDLFGERQFALDNLINQLIEHDVGYVTGKDEPERYLDLLVEHGLLAQEDGQYRIRCAPEEKLSAWRERIRSPEAIYQLVQQAKRRQRRASDRDASEVLVHENEEFVSLPADEETVLSSFVTRIAEHLDNPPIYDGIVLRTPAAQLGHVQQLADDLCDAETMADTDLSYHFEKVISNIRGEHKDDLEYRLYLRTIH